MTDGERDRSDGGYRAEYDWSSVEPSTAVLEVVARATGRNPENLDVLNETLDPDALDAVVSTDAVTDVSFTYCEYEVIVRSDGTVRARPA